MQGLVCAILFIYLSWCHPLYGFDSHLPIVFVYEVVPAVCELGLPHYIKDVLEQAVEIQVDAKIIFASNFGSCPRVKQLTDTIKGIQTFDTEAYASNRTHQFRGVAKQMFHSDGGPELWITSASRFLYLEDLMRHFNFKELLHVESDNLLYGRISSLLADLRENYDGLAATPANAQVTFITASVLWVHDQAALQQFNDFMLRLGSNRSEWLSYIAYLRPHFCCKQNGVEPDAEGNGIQPFAVNEMSIMAFYRFKFPDRFKLLPVLPQREYRRYRYIVNLNLYTAAGTETGGATGVGIWDPGSWGQHLGGIAISPHNSKGFSDPTHIPGQAMRVRNCRPAMLCSNSSWLATDNVCRTAPFVRCLEGQVGDELWTPLWNLHVHSKHAREFRSVECACKL